MNLVLLLYYLLPPVVFVVSTSSTFPSSSMASHVSTYRESTSGVADTGSTIKQGVEMASNHESANNSWDQVEKTTSNPDDDDLFLGESIRTLEQNGANDSDKLPASRDVFWRSYSPMLPIAEFILGYIVQPYYLTRLETRLGDHFNKSSGLIASVKSSTKVWVVYFIGFIVVGGLGVLAVVVLLMLGMIWVCKSRGGRVTKKHARLNRRRVVLNRISLFKSLWTPPIESYSWRKWVGMFIFSLFLSTALILGGLGVGLCGATASKWVSHGALNSVNASFYQAVHFVRATLFDIETVLMRQVEQLLNDTLRTFNSSTNSLMDELNLITSHKDGGVFNELHKVKTFCDSAGALADTNERASKTAAQLSGQMTGIESTLSNAKTTMTASTGSCVEKACVDVTREVESLTLSPSSTRYLSISGRCLALSVVFRSEAKSGALLTTIKVAEGSLEETLKWFKSITANAFSDIAKAFRDLRQLTHEFIIRFWDMFHQILSLKFDDAIRAQRTTTLTIGLGVLLFALFMVGLIAAVIPLFIFGFVMLTFGWWSHRRRVRRISYMTTNKIERHRMILQGCRSMRSVEIIIAATAWIHMFVAALFFILAGLFYTEVCRHIEVAVDDPKSEELRNQWDDWITGGTKQDHMEQIRMLRTFSRCRVNMTLYMAAEVKSANDFLKVVNSTNAKYVVEMLKSLDLISPPHPTIITDLLKTAVSNFVTAIDKAGVDVMVQEVQAATTSKDVILLIGKVESLSGLPGVDELQLQVVIGKLNVIVSLLENIEPARIRLLDDLIFTQTALAAVDFDNLLNKLVDDQRILQDKLVPATRTVLKQMTSGLMDAVEHFLLSVVFELQYSIGRCRPVFLSVNRLLDGVCIQLIGFMNSLWVGVGWCLVFLAPMFGWASKLSCTACKPSSMASVVPNPSSPAGDLIIVTPQEPEDGTS